MVPGDGVIVSLLEVVARGGGWDCGGEWLWQGVLVIGGSMGWWCVVVILGGNKKWL